MVLELGRLPIISTTCKEFRKVCKLYDCRNDEPFSSMVEVETLAKSAAGETFTMTMETHHHQE
jgi:hypothetical protein